MSFMKMDFKKKIAIIIFIYCKLYFFLGTAFAANDDVSLLSMSKKNLFELVSNLDHSKVSFSQITVDLPKLENLPLDVMFDPVVHLKSSLKLQAQDVFSGYLLMDKEKQVFVWQTLKPLMHSVAVQGGTLYQIDYDLEEVQSSDVNELENDFVLKLFLHNESALSEFNVNKTRLNILNSKYTLIPINKNSEFNRIDIFAKAKQLTSVFIIDKQDKALVISFKSPVYQNNINFELPIF